MPLRVRRKLLTIMINSQRSHSSVTETWSAIIESLPSQTNTKAGWCLRQGLLHVRDNDTTASNLGPIIHLYGIPSFYQTVQPKFVRQQETDDAAASIAASITDTDAENDIAATTMTAHDEPRTCFASLCRIVVSQFVSNKAANVAWKRLLRTVTMTPQAVLTLTKSGGPMEIVFQQPAGLTKNKALTIVDLAQRFVDGRLSEELLIASDEDAVRALLLCVKGIGPWSVDMFLMFYLERPNVLPLGDLGVRKGLMQQFGWKSIDAKKDKVKIEERLRVFEPYRSLVTYYMWKIAEAPMKSKTAGDSSANEQQQSNGSSGKRVLTTPSTPVNRRKQARNVTLLAKV
jgi:DNA-3-methyladenine glycosylase II